jgi:pimeloyl-ACP methyl ester carboxylesterase
MAADEVTTSMYEQPAEFHSLDGLRLSATLTMPAAVPSSAAVMVHGGGVTRDEGGFFTRLAAGISQAGGASLRFDLRGHGASDGRQEDLTLAGIMNDIRAAVAHLAGVTGVSRVDVIGASFGGGVTGCFAAHHPKLVRRLVLFNPLVNYKKRFIDDKPYWHDDRIDEVAGQELSANGYLPHSPTFKLGRPLLNEVFYLRPDRVFADIQAPTLIIHGTRDTFIPVDSSRRYIQLIGAETKLLEVDGAQHGIAVHDDPQYLDPQTIRWQTMAIEAVTDWLS